MAPRTCRSACPTQDHATYGQCLRSARINVGWARHAAGNGWCDTTQQRRWDGELREFENAARQGIVPDSTRTADIRRAVKLSDRYGAAYGRDFADQSTTLAEPAQAGDASLLRAA